VKDDELHRINTIRRRLIRWWNKIIDGNHLFPWRASKITPYTALITEILLQRTRAEAVLTVYPKFFLRFPSPAFLCAAKTSDIKHSIHSLGLHWRAEKLRALGCAIGQSIPDNFNELIKLPNVGPYAAGAYLSLHRGKRAIIPDANMVRILGRIFGFSTHAETRRESFFLELCELITPKKNFREFNYSIIDFGRLICTPKNPLSDRCFLNDKCIYFNKDIKGVKYEIV
jgi:A/G-specific adenine glycosylase